MRYCKEEFGALLKIERKKRGMDNLIVTDESHPFWSSVSNQPICSSKTILNIENSKTNVDDAIGAFLVGKLGYQFAYDDDYDSFFDLTGRIQNSLNKNEGYSLKNLYEELIKSNYSNFFLLQQYQDALLACLTFILDNDYQKIIDFVEQGYPINIYCLEVRGFYHFNFMIYNLLIEHNYRIANYHSELISWLSNMDWNILALNQLTYLNTLMVFARKMQSALNDYDQIFASHYDWFIRKSLDYYTNAALFFDENSINKFNNTLFENVAEKDNINLVLLVINCIMANIAKGKSYKKLYDFISKIIE